MVLLNFNNQKHLQLIDFIFNIFILMIKNIYICVVSRGQPIIGLADYRRRY